MLHLKGEKPMKKTFFVLILFVLSFGVISSASAFVSATDYVVVENIYDINSVEVRKGGGARALIRGFSRPLGKFYDKNSDNDSEERSWVFYLIAFVLIILLINSGSALVKNIFQFHTYIKNKSHHGKESSDTEKGLFGHLFDISVRAGICLVIVYFLVNGFTTRISIMKAALGGNIEVVKTLLDDGVNPDEADALGQTPLLAAVFNGHVEIVEILLNAGANPDITYENGATALMLAANKGYVEVVNILLNCGANLDIKDNDGDTALGLSGSLAVFEAFVQHFSEIEEGKVVESCKR